MQWYHLSVIRYLLISGCLRRFYFQVRVFLPIVIIFHFVLWESLWFRCKSWWLLWGFRYLIHVWLFEFHVMCFWMWFLNILVRFWLSLFLLLLWLSFRFLIFLFVFFWFSALLKQFLCTLGIVYNKDCAICRNWCSQCMSYYNFFFTFTAGMVKLVAIFALRDVIWFGIIISDVETFFIDLYCDIYEAVFFKTFSKKNEKFVFGGCINYSFV